MVQSHNWEHLAKNQIAGRDWFHIRNVWSASAREFEPSMVSGLSAVLDPIVGPNFRQRPHVSVFNFPGIGVASFHDAATALIKCAYVLRTVGNCLLSGQPTWASVDAYHFSLIACRAVLALLGVHFVRIQSTVCVLDAFPEGDLETVRRKFRKANPNAVNPTRLIFRDYNTLVEQRDMWTILRRALRVTNFADPARKVADSIIDVAESLGYIRNEILYGNDHWQYEEDFLQPTVAVALKDNIQLLDEKKYRFEDERDSNFALARALAGLLINLNSDVVELSGIELIRTSYSPCLVRFDGFDVHRLDELFATVYEKQAYGLPL